ncbi:MAG: DinB family protein, partial [Gemmatimonadales bacterium]
GAGSGLPTEARVHSYTFLLDTYATERLKTLSVWSHFTDDDLAFRPEPRARTPLEQMVHQCVSEDVWMRQMLGIDAGLPPLPERENKLGFLMRYAEASGRRLEKMTEQPEGWFAQETRFFDVDRSRAWVLTRRIAHSAHHRGQLTAYLRLLRRSLYSTYGPTADTGGLFQQGAPVIYRYDSVAALLAAEREGGADVHRLPGPGAEPPTERPGS